MAQQYDTASGRVFLEPMGDDEWGVFAEKKGNSLIGTVEKKSGGMFAATPLNGRPIECASLDEAVQIVAA
jgi:hypothetical protein